MKSYLLIIAISIVSLFVQACEAQPKLPEEMPEDFQITLTENVTERRTVYIRNSELIVNSGSGFHNHKSEKYAISREEVERIYTVLLENKIDRINQKPKTDWGDDPKSEYQIEVRYNTNYLWLKSNPPTLSAEENIRFERLRLAISDFAEKHKMEKQQ